MKIIHTMLVWVYEQLEASVIRFLFFLVVISLTAGYIYYSKTGGRGLTRVIFYYFFRNIPDKNTAGAILPIAGKTMGSADFIRVVTKTDLACGL